MCVNSNQPRIKCINNTLPPCATRNIIFHKFTMSHESENYSKYQRLLRDLKTTVESLLNSQVTYLWNIYGGLNRLHVDLEKIFKHGCKGTAENSWDYWPFIQGLEWLQPETSMSMNTSFSIESECKNNLPVHVSSDRASIWLYRNLENHALSPKLSWLLSDKNHMDHCYYQHAFLCQPEYAEATLYCLRAIELNQPSLISEISPKLFVNKGGNYYKVHRRCSSFPDAHLKTIRDRRVSNQLAIFESLRKHGRYQSKPKSRALTLRTWKSMPNLSSVNVNKMRHRSYTTHTSPSISTPIANASQPRKGKATSKTKHVLIDCNIIEHTPPESASHTYSLFPPTNIPGSIPSSLASSVPEFSFLGSISGISGEKDTRNLPKKTFIEDGGLSVMPMATGYFPKPAKGQSLTSFLLSSQASRSNAGLDRENAHFNVCEAIIAAMEQIKFDKTMKISEEQQDESDEEINHLKQRIRLRRRQKIEEKQRRLWANSLSDGRTDTTTEASPASMSSSPDAFSASISSESEEEDDISINELSNLQDNTDLSMSMASLFSDVDIMKKPRGVPDGADNHSAESVALSLISKFNDKQLPRASDLEWLVSEKEAPQALLPLPKSWPVNPDDADIIITPLRGTKEWAPPRPQIIFTLHAMPSRKEIMEKQNYRCAGCGTRVAIKYANKFRYCNYLGRSFCTGCHTNQVAIIPARVIHQWNFTRCAVSTFSYRLIEQMYTDPLFRIFELNPKIEKQSRNLQTCRRYRNGMRHLKDYIMTCRHAEEIQDFITTEPSYLFNDPDIYSLNDLVQVRNGYLKGKLKSLVEICCRHTTECEVCALRGYICEICKSPEVLYPWHMKTVSRCATCGNCFHSSCWNKVDAPCIRCCRRIQS